MQKRLLAFLLLIALICSSFSRFIVYAGFEANKEYIAKVLCVNRDKPWMHCNGKCYLVKKVQQAEQNEKKEAAKESLNNLGLSFFQKNISISFRAPVTEIVPGILVPYYNCTYDSIFVGSVFHPPRMA